MKLNFRHPLLLTASFFLAVFFCLPLFYLFLSWLEPRGEVWDFIMQTLFWKLTFNSLILVCGVLFFSSLLGVSTAWLCACCDFPLRRFFNVSLIMPVAIPAYILAFVYVGALDYSSMMMGFFRSFGMDLTAFLEIRSLAGAIFILSLSLYPYVFIFSRQAFLSIGQEQFQVAKSFAKTPREYFINVALPMARPFIAGACFLVCMETLADFGAVSALSVDTFTTAIYDAWYGMFSLTTAAQLAVFLIVVSLALRFFEESRQKNSKFTSKEAGLVNAPRFELNGWKSAGATLYCAFICFLGVGFPIMQLAFWIFTAPYTVNANDFFKLVYHSIFFAFFAAGLIVVVAFQLAVLRRFIPGKLTWLLTRVSILGYALPGTVLAVGAFLVFSDIDYVLGEFTSYSYGITGFLALVLAYTSRFLAVPFSGLDSTFQRVEHRLDDVLSMLGKSTLIRLYRVYVPILNPVLWTSFLLVFVDVIKEMPITLMLRPTGWDTLSTKIYEWTAEGEWEQAALPSLLLAGVSFIAALFLQRSSNKGH